MKNVLIGTKIKDKEKKRYLEMPVNRTSTPNRNMFMIATQGSGKTNYLMLLMYVLTKTWEQTNNQYGALPIVFAPTFEFLNIEKPSRRFNLPDETEPQGLPCVHATFPICEPIPNDKLKTCAFDFSQLDARGILGFTDFSDDDKYIGAIKKLIFRIEHGYEKKVGKETIEIEPRDFTLENFIEEVKEDSALKDALYHVFTELDESGMFDTEKYEAFDFRTLLLEKKPIIIHFGDLDDRQRMSGIAGMIFKQLWEISGIYYNAVNKKERKEKLDDFEQFLVENWTIALFMEEAHQILYATKSSGMSVEAKHPAHYWFKKITALMGRKRGFKYSLIVTQKFMEIFYGIRTTFDELIIGRVVYPDDKEFLNTDLKISQMHINEITKLPKYGWSIVDIQKYQKRQRSCVKRIMPYLAPCGQT